MKTIIFLLALNIICAVALFHSWPLAAWLNGLAIGLLVADLRKRLAEG